MAELGQYLTSINQTKINLMRDTDDEKAVSGFSPFWVRRLLSYHEDCIYIVNELNCTPGLDEQLQYEFLLHGIPKGKRFAKAYRAPPSEKLDLIKKFYGYNDVRAAEVLAIHTDDDLEKMRKHFDQGGVISAEPKSKRNPKKRAS